MKKLLAGLLIIGATSAMAQEFEMPRIEGALILSSSDEDTVCNWLTRGNSSNAKMVKVERFIFPTPTDVVKVKKGSTTLNGKIYGPRSFNDRAKLISKIICD